MRKIAFFILAFCGASIILYLLTGLNNKEMIYIHYLQAPAMPVAENEISKIIKDINIKNSKTKSFSCQNAEIFIDNCPFKLQSFLFYEKKMNFRMVVRSFVGKELDMGSNNKHFWFWSKRMNPPYLYYAKHEDLHKTQLKTPFNPKWIMESLGFDEINKSVRAIKSGNYLILEEDRLSATNDHIVKKTLINIESKSIIGHYLFDEGILIASAEKYSNTLKIIWHEENVGILFKLNNVVFNNKINETYWSMPNYRNRIDMGKN